MGAFDGGNFHVVLVHKCSAHSLKCFMLNRVGTMKQYTMTVDCWRCFHQFDVLCKAQGIKLDSL